MEEKYEILKRYGDECIDELQIDREQADKIMAGELEDESQEAKV